MKKIIIAILVCIFLLAACNSLCNPKPEEVTSQKTLIWANQSDPNNYSEAKAEMKKLIEDEFGVAPEKIAFIVGEWGSGLPYSYEVYIYYLVEEKWYMECYNWLDDEITPELDFELMKIANY